MAGVGALLCVAVTNYERAFSQESYNAGCGELAFPHFDRKTAEHNIRVRRRVVIISTGTTFTVTSIIMVMSMVQNE